MLRWKRLLLTLISLSNIYLKCLGIHQNVLGTIQNDQDIIPDFKNTQSSKLILLNGHQQQTSNSGHFPNLMHLWFPSACSVVVGNTCRGRSLKIINLTTRRQSVKIRNRRADFPPSYHFQRSFSYIDTNDLIGKIRAGSSEERSEEKDAETNCRGGEIDLKV